MSVLQYKANTEYTVGAHPEPGEGKRPPAPHPAPRLSLPPEPEDPDRALKSELSQDTGLKPVDVPQPRLLLLAATGPGGPDACRGHPGTRAGLRN